MRKRSVWLGALVVALTTILLVATGGAAAHGDDHDSANASTASFKAKLKPKNEVPAVTDLRRSRGKCEIVLDDLVRNADADAEIDSGEVIFFCRYRFTGAVTLSGLHIHVGAAGTNGAVVVNSGLVSQVDPDGVGVLAFAVPTTDGTTLEAILANPEGYYVNLHTTSDPGNTASGHPDGAMRGQLKGGKHHDD